MNAEKVRLQHFKVIESKYKFVFFIAYITAPNLPWVPLSIFFLNNAVMKKERILFCSLLSFQSFDIFVLILHNVRHQLEQSVIFS